MKTVAIIGASSDRRKFGNRAFRAFRDEGYNVITPTITADKSQFSPWPRFGA